MNNDNFDLPSFQLMDMIDGDSEFIPLLSAEDEKRFNKEELPEQLPILALRNTVLFPGMVIPITVGREKSVKLVKEVYRKNKILGVVAQCSEEVEDPKFDDLYHIGTVASILKLLQMPDGNTTVIIQGKRRFEMTEEIQEKPYMIAKIISKKEKIPAKRNKEFNALKNSVKDFAIKLIKENPHTPDDSSIALLNIESPSFLFNFIAGNLRQNVEKKQALLEIDDVVEKAHMILSYLNDELQSLELKNQIQDKVKIDMDKQQREYILNQQLKKIQEELGDDPQKEVVNELIIKSKKKKWNDETKSFFEKELAKLKRINPMAPDYSNMLNFLEFFVELPWGECTKDNNNLTLAEKGLNSDHYGLEKVKERIVEHLAVLMLKKDMKSPILCFVGPPGVGKTSLGESIAKALNRKYIRVSVGGLRDESEIRGHRKTYIGALPGRIIQNIKKVGSSNPVFILDEVDKIAGMNVSGDPSAALLEVLDPEQNNAFYDNYLEADYDLSKVMFIATANTLSTIHPALRDRMEIIDIAGYLMEEKVEIAKKFIIPKLLKSHGITSKQISFRKSILELLILGYTKESGVRSLGKVISKILRYRAKQIVKKEEYNVIITNEDVKKILGVERFSYEKQQSFEVPGIMTGLAWTSVGGEILFIEVSKSKGKGKLALTGNLGDVMKESATIALEYLKANAKQFGIDENQFEELNIHIHVPEGATPKDGPSAGVTIFTALASAFTGRTCKSNFAMTGEITLRGKITAIGGVKEKILAAKRANINHLVLSEENRKDIQEIDEKYIKGMEFNYIKYASEALDLCLNKK